MFSKWETLHKALAIQVDIDQSIIDIHDQQYLAILIKSKHKSSAYALEREREDIGRLMKEAASVSAQETGAFTLHSTSHYSLNRNYHR
jgi:hypothetical protein